MKKITINELPAWSAWPKRLLGVVEWKKPTRDTAKVEDEYNLDKYAKCLEFLKASSPRASMEAVKTFELGPDAQDTCVSIGPDELAVMPLKEARETYYKLIAEHLKKEFEDGITVVELGCGYGYNLQMLNEKMGPNKSRWWGGEYSSNAVEIGKILHAATDGKISVHSFNFYDADYDLPQDGKLLVYTAHAIEQLPDASNVIAALAKHKSRIKAVIHFEPGYDLQTESLLDLMRKRYFEINDYNQNLVAALKKQAADVEILEATRNVFGLNPFNPTSIVKWRFR